MQAMRSHTSRLCKPHTSSEVGSAVVAVYRTNLSPTPAGKPIASSCTKFRHGIGGQKQTTAHNVCSRTNRRASIAMQSSSAEAPTSNKFVVLVTGCSGGGIGHALCTALTQRGCNVVATARKMAAMDDLRDVVTSRIELDVTSSASITSAVQQVISEHGRIDMLINNAGCATAPMSVVESSLDSWRQVYEVNLFGVVAVTQAVAHHMIEQRCGRIVNIGSIAGWNCVPFTSPYSSSKAALQSLSQALRLELRPFGVQVMHVAPGFVRTRIADNARGLEEGHAYQGELYKDAPEVISKMNFMMDGVKKPGAMPVEVFAAKLADILVLPHGSTAVPPMWSAGQFAGFIGFAVRWFPTWLLDAMNQNSTGLDALERQMKRTAITRKTK